jgi:hypothetical protein
VRESKRPNISLLREVNDRVFELLSEMGHGDAEFQDAEFVCECSNEYCVETIQLTLREYASLQAQPERPPLKLRGHPD